MCSGNGQTALHGGGCRLCGGAFGAWLSVRHHPALGRVFGRACRRPQGGGGWRCQRGPVAFWAACALRLLPFTDRLALSVGVGQMRALRGNGLDSTIGTLGVFENTLSRPARKKLIPAHSVSPGFLCWTPCATAMPSHFANAGTRRKLGQIAAFAP